MHDGYYLCAPGGVKIRIEGMDKYTKEAYENWDKTEGVKLIRSSFAHCCACNKLIRVADASDPKEVKEHRCSA